MKRVYCCGFNGFGQIIRDSGDGETKRHFYEKPVHLCDIERSENIQDVLVCWSSIIFLIKGKDSTILKCFGDTQIVLNEGDEIRNMTSSAKYCVCYTQRNRYKLFDLKMKTEVDITDGSDCVSNQIDSENKQTDEDIAQSKTESASDHSKRQMESQTKTTAPKPMIVKQLLNQENDFYSLYDNGLLMKIEIRKLNQSLSLNYKPVSVKIHVSSLSCGKEHIILVTDHNQVFTFGLGSRGQLGNGDVESVKEPQEVEALSGISVKTVSAGGWHSSAVTDDGDLYVWGWNESGQLGLPCPLLSSSDEIHGIVALPTYVDLPAPVAQVSCGSRHTTVLLDNGDVMSCGWNKYGQLGVGDTLSRDQFTKINFINPRERISHIKAGSWNSIFCCRPKF